MVEESAAPNLIQHAWIPESQSFRRLSPGSGVFFIVLADAGHFIIYSQVPVDQLESKTPVPS
jgi:hypothetical protein